MKVLQSESITMPLELDETSSPTTVYVRTDIEEHEREEEDGTLTTYYTYTETQYTTQEYEVHELRQLTADLSELVLFGGEA